MIFETAPLESPLDTFIASIFYFKDFKPDHSIERVVPTGHIFILFELDGISRKTYDPESLSPLQTFTKVWISGMHKNYLSISAHQDSEMFVIQLKPLGGFPFFHFPIHQLNDTVIAAEEILGNEILDLREKILEAHAIKDKFRLAKNWLISRLDLASNPDEELHDIVSQLKTQPLSSHKQIIETYPKSQKHLISQFKKFCGLTPKVFHRIMRFNEILKQIHEQKQIQWAQLAHEWGYTDQSHFIKEFKEFSGFNPSEFISLALENEEANFFPLDREG